MARLNRIEAKIFASNAGADQIAKFGSLAASAPAFTTDADEAQSLSQFLSGWFSAVIGGNSPCIEDMNALFYVITYQIAQIMQSGVPEYNAATTYYSGQMCSDGAGTIYVSLVDDNIGNALTDSTKWRTFIGGKEQTLISTGAIAPTSQMVWANATSGNIVATLPALSSVPVGWEVALKCIHTNANTVQLKGNGAETVDGNNTFSTDLVTMDLIRVRKYDATNWYSV